MRTSAGNISGSTMARPDGATGQGGLVSAARCRTGQWRPCRGGGHVVAAGYAFHGITAGDLLRVQQAIGGKNYRVNSQAGDWVGKAVAEVLGFDLDRNSDLARVKSLLKTWIDEGALETVTATDAQRKTREFVEVKRWAT